MNATFKPSDFIKLLFKTLSLVGDPDDLDKAHNNPPRDLRITALKKTLEIWGITNSLCQIATGKIWEDPNFTAQQVKNLREEFPPESYANKNPLIYEEVLRASANTLIRYRKRLASPQEFLTSFIVGGGLTKIMESLHEKSERIKPTIDEVDELLVKFLLPGAYEIPREMIQELEKLEEADIEYF